MSINLRTGQPGHGKSFSAVVEIRNALERGQYVATNVPLSEDWAERMVRTNPFTVLWGRVDRLRGKRPTRVELKADRYRTRLYAVVDLSDLRRLRLPSCGKCPGCKNGPGCQKEGRGLAVLDEAHQWLNSRTWDADETGKAVTRADAVRRRLAIVRFFATHRHRGWNVELLTQSEGNLDNQVRGLYETHTHLKNIRRYRWLGLFPLVPFNLFVAVTLWHDAERSRQGVRVYPLNRRLARCYDTFGAGRHLDEDEDEPIYLGNVILADDPAFEPGDDPADQDATGDKPSLSGQAEFEPSTSEVVDETP